MMRTSFIFLFFLSIILMFNDSFAQGDASGETKYFGSLTSQEKNSIRFIINTLANKSSLALLGEVKELEDAGTKSETVHPLRFWKEVLTDKQLKQNLKEIGMIPRSRLIKDFANRFKAITNREGWKQKYVQDFSQHTGISQEKLNQFARQGNWTELVKLFFKSTGS